MAFLQHRGRRWRFRGYRLAPRQVPSDVPIGVLCVLTRINVITGYYKPWLVFGPWLMIIGSALMYTINEDTSSAKLIGFQIVSIAFLQIEMCEGADQIGRRRQLVGCGVGTCLQNTIIAVQVDIKNEDDVSQATALVTFARECCTRYTHSNPETDSFSVSPLPPLSLLPRNRQF